MGERPVSLEGRWDILYCYYPEVYDAFARIPKRPDMLEVLNERFDFRGKVIVDVGSGTGLSTFQLARWAAQVIGVEPEEAMRELALTKASGLGLACIRFERGDVEHIPLPDGYADAAVGITQANGDPHRVCAEMERGRDELCLPARGHQTGIRGDRAAGVPDTSALTGRGEPWPVDRTIASTVC